MEEFSRGEEQYSDDLHSLRQMSDPPVQISQGRPGRLVKCLVERIVEDNTAGDLKCPHCQQEFARLQMIGSRPAHKIIQGKVYTRGMRRK